MSLLSLDPARRAVRALQGRPAVLGVAEVKRVGPDHPHLLAVPVLVHVPAPPRVAAPCPLHHPSAQYSASVRCSCTSIRAPSPSVRPSLLIPCCVLRCCLGVLTAEDQPLCPGSGQPAPVQPVQSRPLERLLRADVEHLRQLRHGHVLRHLSCSHGYTVAQIRPGGRGPGVI